MTFSSAVFILVALTTTGYIILAYFAAQFNNVRIPTVTIIDSVLPQTQCGECGYPGCKPYAQAMMEGEAINKCLPGGDETIEMLSLLLNKPFSPLDGKAVPNRIAFIREAECIGCTKCIQACPVDAILGAAKQMHTVITEECTGCDLCVDPCPVDCIDMITVAAPTFDKNRSRARFEFHTSRIEKEEFRKVHYQEQTPTPSNDEKAALIAAAIARTEAKKSARLGDSPDPNQSDEA